MECENALEYVRKLREEGFSTEQIDKLLPKLEEVAALKKEDLQELKERMELLVPAAQKEVTVVSETEKSFQRMYMGFGGAVTELLKQNNEAEG
jgi:DNA-binding transcriptional MerR regulator